MKQFFVSALEVLEVAFVALGLVFIIRTFLVQPFLVQGASMSPNFSNGDYLLIDELSYYLREPQRGEVIVFKFNQGSGENVSHVYYIKRVIGLPGEKIEIKDGKVVVYKAGEEKGFTLPEDYLPRGRETLVRPGGQSAFVLKEGEFLALGDNRSYSYDSRDWGVVHRDWIVGTARFRLWPPRELQVFAAPNYQ
ncbi:MAG TPA: signal peptidase I [Candidatus Paceibacterota bacterium]